MHSKIQTDLLNMRDEKFARFNANLLPNIKPENICGVRTPDLRKYAKKITHPDKFLSELPHKYFEENQVHAFLLSDIRDFEKCTQMIDVFLPYMNNWATCDQLIPKFLQKIPINYYHGFANG